MSYHTLQVYHVLKQYASTTTLCVPEQVSSIVTYLMVMELYRTCLWGHMIVELVSLAHGVSSWLLAVRYPRVNSLCI